MNVQTFDHSEILPSFKGLKNLQTFIGDILVLCTPTIKNKLLLIKH